MQKTEHYQLNQWEKTDRILMEDFNADNQKIEAALDSVERTKLLQSITVETNTSSLELDTSTLNWSDYHEVILYAELKGSGSNTAWIYLNGATGSSYYKRGSFYGTGCSSATEFAALFMTYNGTVNKNKLTFYPGGSVMNAHTISCGADYTGQYSVTANGSGITGTNVTKIQLKPSSGSILAGSQVWLYGIRK